MGLKVCKLSYAFAGQARRKKARKLKLIPFGIRNFTDLRMIQSSQLADACCRELHVKVHKDKELSPRDRQADTKNKKFVFRNTRATNV
jgi:hypothetical protein